MIDRKEIDLLIRASVQNKQDLASIPKTIKALEEALDKQAAAAKRGESSIDQLKSTLLSLEQAQSALTSNAGLVGAFQKMGDAIKVQEERVSKAARTYQDYKTKLEGIAEVTEAQQARLVKLSSANERAAATLLKQQTGYAELGKALQQAGVDTNNLSEAERQLRETAASLGVVMAKNRDAISSYAEVVGAARAAEKQRAAESAANAKQQADALAAVQRQQDALYQSSKKLAEQQASAKDAFARDNALVKQADDAERAARGYTSLARAATDLSPQVLSVRSALSQILNPASDAEKSLTGLEKSIRDVATSVSSIKGPVDNYRQSLASLDEAQKSITTKAGLIESFRRQVDAVRAARQEMQTARAEVTKYADAVRQGGDSGQRFSQSLATAQARLQAASVAMAAQVSAARSTREQLAAAGIATTQLADAEQRLVGAARQSVDVLNQLTNAVNQYGQASQKASNASIGNGERTTLNFLQRLRGQVLSVTASYIGLFGAIQQAKGAIDSLVAFQTINQRIGTALDTLDARKIGQEYDYLRDRANYYGIGLKQLADSYGSYANAAKQAGYTAQNTKFTFEQLTAGFRVQKLSSDQMNRAFIQVNQILQKTKPELEDLKTMAEAGVPAQALMAKGLRMIGVEGIRAGTEVQDMSKLMKKGLISSQDAIYALAVSMQEQLGKQVPSAIKTLQAEMGRFETAWFEFQNKIANSGFGDAVQKALVELRLFLNSDEGTKAATSIGQAFAAIVNGAITLAKNLETVKDLSIAFIAIWLGARFVEGITALTNLKNSITATGTAMTATQKIFAGFQALIIGWTIGSIAREKFKIVDEAGQWMADGLLGYFALIKNSFLGMAEVLPVFFTNAMKAIVNGSTAPIRAITNQFANLAGALGMDGVAGSLRSTLNTVTFQYEDLAGIISARKNALMSDLAAIKNNRKALDDLRTRDGVKLASGAYAAPTASGGRPTSQPNEDDKKAEAAARKRAAQIESITKSLEELSARTDKAQSDSLSAQLQAVDTQYEQLSRKIKALGGKEGAEFAKQFAEGIASLKGQITEKFNKKLADEQDSITKKLEDADAAAGRRSKESLDARLKAVSDKYAQTYREIADYRRKLEQNNQDPAVADQMKARLDAGVKEIQNLETQRYYKETLADKEKEVNELVASRTAMIKTQKDLEEAGLINNATMRQNIEQIINTTQPQIEAMAASASAFATSLQGAFDPARIQEFVAKMQLATASGKALNKEFEITGKQINEQIAQQGTKAIGTMTDAIGKAITGQITWKEALRETGKAALQFFADLIKWYAEAIIKQQILNSVQGGSGGVGGFIAGLFSGGVKHEGGVIGGVSNRTREMPAAWFANAPRYHSGGVMGLASNEFATVLKKNEEVLTDSDPRNILNGGLGLAAAAGGGGGGGGPTTFVLVDDKRRTAEAMATAAGGRVIMQQIKAQIPTIRQWMKGG